MEPKQIEQLIETFKSLDSNIELLSVFVAILIIAVCFIFYRMMPNPYKEYCLLTKEEVDEMIDYAFTYKYNEMKIAESKEEAFKLALEYYNELINKGEKK